METIKSGQGRAWTREDRRTTNRNRIGITCSNQQQTGPPRQDALSQGTDRDRKVGSSDHVRTGQILWKEKIAQECSSDHERTEQSLDKGNIAKVCICDLERTG